MLPSDEIEGRPDLEQYLSGTKIFFSGTLSPLSIDI